MSLWTLQILRALDRKYAEEGVPTHARAFRAAMEILGSGFVIGAVENPEVRRIFAAYEGLRPDMKESWPGMGIGLAAVGDHVRRVTVPVVFGSAPLEPWQALGFENGAAWWSWCGEDRTLAGQTHFAFADLLDLTYGLKELASANQRARELWEMATSNLSDIASTLPGTFSVDSVLQPICLVAELSLKAALVQNGGDPDGFAKRGGEGHDLVRLAARLHGELPHGDDQHIGEIISRAPAYVKSRYAPAGLTRLEVVRLALGVQFIAASSVRRFSDAGYAKQVEQGDWPGPRTGLLT